MHQGTNYRLAALSPNPCTLQPPIPISNLDSRYASWQPIDTDLAAKGTLAPYYGNIAVAAFLGDLTSTVPRIANLPLPNEEEAAYAAYVNDTLARIVVINMQEYNSSTQTNNYTDDYPRPVERYSFQLPQGCSGKATTQRLLANGSDAITGITFDGYSYNYELDNGMPVLLNNVTRGETVSVDRRGRMSVDVPRSSAVIVRLECEAGCK